LHSGRWSVIDHEEAIYALRTKVKTLSVVTATGSFSATATDYQRAAGSFINDGYRVGMEVKGTGFSNSENNAAKTITGVATSTLTCAGNVVEVAASRTLAVGLPATRVWANSRSADADGVPDNIEASVPYFTEEYLPGPMAQETLGTLAQLEVLPQYIPRIFVPANTGVAAAMKHTTALLALFAPGTAFTLSVSSSTMRVRRDVAPFSGQLTQASPGFAVVPITVPLRLRTANSI